MGLMPAPEHQGKPGGNAIMYRRRHTSWHRWWWADDAMIAITKARLFPPRRSCGVGVVVVGVRGSGLARFDITACLIIISHPYGHIIDSLDLPPTQCCAASFAAAMRLSGVPTWLILNEDQTIQTKRIIMYHSTTSIDEDPWSFSREVKFRALLV